MQHQNTTPESPEAEHQQAKMENLMDISLPLVDQEPFQEILQALLKNDMSHTIPSDIALDIIPIITPSIMNGARMKLFVAPTYFIIDISFLLA